MKAICTKTGRHPEDRSAKQRAAAYDAQKYQLPIGPSLIFEFTLLRLRCSNHTLNFKLPGWSLISLECLKV